MFFDITKSPHLDAAAARLFLRWHESSSECTQRTYRKEVWRFLLWTHLVASKTLPSLTRHDIDDYERFLANPPNDWCGPRASRYQDDKFDPVWRPFVGALSATSRLHALRIVNAFFVFLLEEDYVSMNPVRLRRRTRAFAEWSNKAKQRMLDASDQRQIWETLKRARPKTKRGKMIEARRRWAVIVLYGLGLRISEASRAIMGDIQEHEEGWKIFLRRKGGKLSWLPCSKEVISELKRYRKALKLQPYPAPSESQPLIAALDSVSPLSTRSLYQIVKNIFRKTARRADRAGRPSERLRQASPHWLRHAALSDLCNRGASIASVQRLADHAKMTTTAIYLHHSDEHLHAAVARHKFNKPRRPRVPRQQPLSAC